MKTELGLGARAQKLANSMSRTKASLLSRAATAYSSSDSSALTIHASQIQQIHTPL
jgi:hypothetical protein